MTGRARGGAAAGREAGFSLAEVLVVVFIIGLTAGLVVLNMPEPRSGAREDAQRLAARLALASQDSVISGAAVGVDISDTGFGFRRYGPGGWTDFGAPGGAFEPHAWSGGVSAAVAAGLDPAFLAPAQPDAPPLAAASPQATFAIDAPPPVSVLAGLAAAGTGGPSRPPPVFVFDPGGAATPFVIELADDGWTVLITVASDGGVTLSAESGNG